MGGSVLLRPCRGGPRPLVTRAPYHTWRGRSSLQSGTLSSVSCQDGKKEGTPSRPCPWRILPDVASLAQARRPSLFLPPAQPDTARSVLHALRSDPLGDRGCTLTAQGGGGSGRTQDTPSGKVLGASLRFVTGVAAGSSDKSRVEQDGLRAASP